MTKGVRSVWFKARDEMAKRSQAELDSSWRVAWGRGQRAYQRLQDYSVPKDFRGRPALFVQIWWLCQSTLFGLSPQALYVWRNWLLRCFGAKIGRRTIIRPSVTVTYPWRLTVGEHCQIGDDVVLYSLGQIDIGDCVVISQRSYLCTGAHDHLRPAFDLLTKPITIESEVWLATDVFVGPGVRIGKGAVVGARSTVLKSVPPATISVGSPARVVGPREMREE
jgi:putative colanic acid biosynthesis acetyltransferase WcaF